MAYIFIDESGNFNKEADGKYFVVGSFTVGDQRRTNKAFRSWTHNRFPKKMRTQSEIKASRQNNFHILHPIFTPSLSDTQSQNYHRSLATVQILLNRIVQI
ncbi:hypothetical protein A2Y83_04255 [Candidatus Falkowbacteria bacterium RBG_13_39_14]|uniref:DUF3800 domain-containing protein n=1 Tax=Candidatus Falkowbacteria bacterium RBG_13_39_14 TaxID=1797985 RepID=A0A1F5S7B1_9BACT|nr:MAG: hypothetical protein A2Y83_04255 [Candidatus Falkowbacteria bacterium RBG_13_39_14]